jgi:hypothetical protein
MREMTRNATGSGSLGFGRAGLPAGVRQADCDGCSGPGPSREGPRDAWQACATGRQERIAMDFALRWAEEVRDVILTADGNVQDDGGDGLSGRMWRAWGKYRDRAPREAARRGMPGG